MRSLSILKFLMFSNYSKYTLFLTSSKIVRLFQFKCLHYLNSDVRDSFLHLSNIRNKRRVFDYEKTFNGGFNILGLSGNKRQTSFLTGRFPFCNRCLNNSYK